MRRTILCTIALALCFVSSCGDATGNGSAATRQPTTTAPATTSPSTTASGTTAPAPSTAAPAKCSAAGSSAVPVAQPGLPPAVASMRADLARATATCDWNALAALVDRGGTGVRFSFGNPGDAIAYWQRGESSGPPPLPLRAMRVLLDLSFATQPLADGVQYVWPAAHVAVPPSVEQLQEIADSGLYPLSTLQEWVRTGNNYLGYRLAITASGDWTFFVAGD